MRTSAPQVILYTRSGCLFCQRYMEIMRQHGVDFEERNVTENPSHLTDLVGHGAFLVPTAVVGERVIPGFRPNTLLGLLGHKVHVGCR